MTIPTFAVCSDCGHLRREKYGCVEFDKCVECAHEERELTPMQRWRIKHRDHYNAKQREYQRAYRARKKARDERG